MFSLKKAHDIEDMVRIIKEHQKLKNALLTKIAAENKDLKILYKHFPMDNYYQIVPLLQEIAKEDLEKSEIEQKNNHRRQSFYFWEETRVRDKESRYEKREIKDLLEDFRNIVPKRKTAIPRFLVIGPPGSGKSTLMQYMARRIARGEIKMGNSKVLPIHISLAKWQRWSDGKNYGLVQYLTTLFSSLSIRPDEIQWQKWLEKGEVLLLLDGLDELSDNVPDFFENAVRKNFQDFPQCPAVLTCRTVVYEQYQTLDIPAFVLAGFEEEQQKKYIKNFPAEKDSQYNPSLLSEQIQDSQMQYLSSNPFILSMICYVVDDPKEKIALPSTRSLFYQKAMDKLLQRTRIAVDCPKLLVKQDVLAKIALDLFLQDQRESFSQAELLCTFRKAIEKSGYSLDKGEALLDDFIKNSGIIQKEPNRDSYFFLHLTFQEFLAANALANIVNDREGEKWESKIKAGNKAYTIRMIADKKAWDPDWQEVMLLFAGQLEDPMPFLEMLYNPKPTRTNPKGDDMFRHRLCLSALCLAEISPEKREAKDLVIDITTEAFGFWWKYEKISSVNNLPHEEQVLQSLARRNSPVWIHKMPHLGIQLTGEIRLLEWLCIAIILECTDSVGNSALNVLKKMREKAATELVLEVLLSLLYDQDLGVRNLVVSILGKMGGKATTESVLKTLLCFLHDQYSDVRYYALKVLLEIGEKAVTKAVLEALPSLLRDQNDDIRGHAVDLLGKMGEKAATEAVLEILLSLLHDQDAAVCYRVVDLLGKMGKKAATEFIFRSLFFSMYRTSNNFGESFALFSIIESASEPAIKHLLSLLHDQDSGVRRQAAEILGPYGFIITNEEKTLVKIIHALIFLLRDNDSVVRVAAVHALNHIANEIVSKKEYQEQIIHSLLPLLRDENSDIRIAVVQIYQYVTSEQAIQFLLPLLRDENSNVRNSAVKALCWKIDITTSGQTIQFLLPLLRDENSNVRNSAVDLLGGIKHIPYNLIFPSWVISSLLSLFCERNAVVIKNAIRALKNLWNNINIADQFREQVIQSLLSLLKKDFHRDRDYRSTVTILKEAASALAFFEKNTASEQVIEYLFGLTGYYNLYVRINATLALLKIEENILRTEALSRFFCYGNCNSWCEENVLSCTRRHAFRDLFDSDEDRDLNYGTAQHNAIILFFRYGKDIFLYLLSHKCPIVRKKTVQALEQVCLNFLKEKATEDIFLQALLTLLHDEDFNVRFDAMRLLGKMRNEVALKAALKDFLPLLQHKIPYIRRQAAKILGNMEANEDIIYALLSLLNNDDDEIYIIAVEALTEIKETSSDRFYQTFLSSLYKNMNVERVHYALNVSEIGEKAARKAVLRILLPFLQEQDDKELSKVLEILHHLNRFGVRLWYSRKKWNFHKKLTFSWVKDLANLPN